MDKKKEIIVVGTTSKFGNYIFKYPLQLLIILLMCFGAFFFLYGEEVHHLLGALKVLLIALLPLIFIMYMLSYKWCYKIELDRSNNTILFYRLFNRAVRTFSFNDRIKIIVGAYFHILVRDYDFILHAEYINEFVSYLPKDTVIEFKGLIGKYMEKHLPNGPLMPGSKL